MIPLTVPSSATRDRQGAVLVWTIAMLVVLLLMVTLAVDFGRIVLVRAELQHAVDAAAREGAAALPANLSTVRNTVIAAAERNAALGQPVQIKPAGVQIVSVGDEPNNAVRVIADLPVPLLFGYLATQRFDVSVAATARRQSGGESYGIVGLDGITATGSSFIDSYDSSAGSYASTRSNNATLASNGNINLSGASQVKGNAFTHNGTVSSPGKVSGSVGELKNPISHPPESATTSSPGGNWSNGYGTLSAGTYYFNNLKLNPPHTLRTTGPVTIYVGGELSIKGKLLPHDNIPSNLRIVVTSNKDVEFTATAEVYAQVYAPLSHITFTGNSTFHGGAIGKTITVIGNADLHHDLALPPSGSGGLSGAVVLVE